jgi:hypothetical protein
MNWATCSKVEELWTKLTNSDRHSWTFMLSFKSLFLWKIWSLRINGILEMESMRPWSCLGLFLSLREIDQSWAKRTKILLLPITRPLQDCLLFFSLEFLQEFLRHPTPHYAPCLIYCLRSPIYFISSRNQEPVRQGIGKIEVGPKITGTYHHTQSKRFFWVEKRARENDGEYESSKAPCKYIWKGDNETPLHN